MAIEIKFLTDVEDVVRGTKTIGDKLEGVADELDAMGRAGDKNSAQLADGFKDAERAAGKAGDGIGDAFKDGSKLAGKSLEGIEDAAKDTTKAADSLGDKASDTFRKLGHEAQAAGDKVGKSTKDGFKEASEGSETFKENAGANAKEVAASFDGSAQSIADGFQGLAAEMLEGFGPAGLAAGVAVAAGIGMATMAMQDSATKATELKQKAVDMLDGIEAVGGDLSKLDYADIIKGWGREVMEDNWLSFWADESTTKFQETAKDAKAAGVDAVEAVKAAAGSADDSRAFLDKTGDAWQKLSERIQQGTTYTAEGIPVLDDAAQAAKNQQDALSDLRGQAEGNIKTTQNATEIYGIETAAVDDGTAALEAKNKALEEQARALSDASGAAMDGVTAEIAYNDAMAGGIKDIKANGKGLDLNTAAGKANQQTLVDMAEAATKLRDAQIEQGDSTATVSAKTQEARDKFIAAARAAGAGSDEAKRLADRYGLVPKNVDTFVKAHDVQKTKNELNGLGAPVKTPVLPYLDVAAKWRFDMDMAQLTAQRTQTVLVKKLTEGVPLP
jgi:hypothetical protein